MASSGSPRSETEQVARKQASSSLLKGLDLIDALAYRGGSFTMKELAQLLGWPVPTVHRMLRSLQLRDFVEVVEGRYRLTLKLFDIGSVVVDRVDVLKEARPICEELCRELASTVNIALRAGASAVHVLFESDTADTIQLFPRPGMQVPLHCTGLGKALLAFTDSATQEQLLDELDYEPRTPNTLRDREALVADLRTTLERGWALDDEECDEGLVCVAAPIFDRFGVVTAAMSVTRATERFPDAERPHVATRVREAAELVSNRIGYRPGSRSVRYAAAR